MNELTERLTVEQPIIMGGADPTVEELRERTGEMGYVLVKFTQTRGGTELGFPLDRDATSLSEANFEGHTGTVHVEGHLVLNGDPVRCIADIDLATLKGTGRLALAERAAAATQLSRWVKRTARPAAGFPPRDATFGVAAFNYRIMPVERDHPAAGHAWPLGIAAASS